MIKQFQGVYTALVTPFDKEGSIDTSALENLIKFNIKEGVTGLVPCGTTGESPTLSHNEHNRVIEVVIKCANDRVPVIAGTGSNCTAEAIALSQHAERSGASAILSVNPYYNKPPQEGLYRHFRAIADSVGIPVILYNIKTRTGVNLETSTLIRLANDCKNIIGVKEASGDMNQIRDVIVRSAPSGFTVLSGDDNLAFEVVKAGGDGVISVASNIIPRQMAKFVGSALDGHYKLAERYEKALSPFFKALFIETNPIPIKYMLSLQGKCEEAYRLPLCELRPESKAKVKAVLEELELI